MKAIVCTKFGLPKAIEYKEVAKPVPEDNQVLVEVHASSVTFSNLILVSGKMFLLRLMVGGHLMSKSRIPGTDMAGRVTGVGKDVKQFRPGDEVYGDLFGGNKGAYAEYVCAPENVLALKPANITFEEAAVVPESALIALQGLRGRVAKGQKVLVIGAAGGICTFAVQIAKYYGPEVTGVCGPQNLDLVRSLGADHVIDYTREDFTKNGEKYDLIFAARKSRSIYDIRRALKPGGIYISAGGPSVKRLFQEFIIGPSAFKNDGKKIAVINISIKQEDLDFIRKLIEAGKIKPVIDRSFPLSETAEAFRYYARGHARGKVAITIRK